MPKIYRLKKRADFVRLTKSDKKRPASSIVLQMTPTPEYTEGDSIRLGFTVTKKLGNAVVRNRIKRRIKAAANDIFTKVAISGHDYVIIGRKAALTCEFSIIERDLKYALKKVHQDKNP